SVSHLVPSGSPFIGGKGVNHIQDGTNDRKKTGHSAGLFIAVFMCNQIRRPSDLLRDSKIGRSVEGNKTVTAVWFQ
ncbi:hypothetical protein, partial [Aeromonas veronii]|uniref:hypothetical protein n=1 Tax=Aeromonas veronii TaxID=654 RepID=UPI003BA11F6D